MGGKIMILEEIECPDLWFVHGPLYNFGRYFGMLIMLLTERSGNAYAGKNATP